MRTKDMVKIVSTLTIVVASMATPARAEIVGAEISVKGYSAYDFGNGDVIFWFSPATALAGCDGAWIAPSQPGAKNMIATLISAKLSGSAVGLNVDNSVIWNASSARFCKVYAMGLH